MSYFIDPTQLSTQHIPSPTQSSPIDITLRNSPADSSDTPPPSQLAITSKSTDHHHEMMMKCPVDPMLFSKIAAVATLPHIYSLSASQIYIPPIVKSSLLMQLFKYTFYSLLLTSSVVVASIYAMQHKDALIQIKDQVTLKLSDTFSTIADLPNSSTTRSITSTLLPPSVQQFLSQSYNSLMSISHNSNDAETDDEHGSKSQYLYDIVSGYSSYLYDNVSGGSDNQSWSDYYYNSYLYPINWIPASEKTIDIHDGSNDTQEGQGVYTSIFYPSTWQPISGRFLGLFGPSTDIPIENQDVIAAPISPPSNE